MVPFLKPFSNSIQPLVINVITVEATMQKKRIFKMSIKF